MYTYRPTITDDSSEEGSSVLRLIEKPSELIQCTPDAFIVIDVVELCSLYL